MEEKDNIIETPAGNRKKSALDPRIKAVFKWLYRAFAGALIGVGAILPGISGGVLCVVFGIYQPMMALLAHPIRTFKTHIWLLLPVLIGWACGFVGLARLVEWMFESSEKIAVWLFIGLIAGMVPSMFKDAGKEGRGKSAWIALAASTAGILTVLLYVQNTAKVTLEPNIWWFFVCGIAWGISLVVPGLSSSSILIYLGLYQPMTAGIADLSFAVILPILAGTALTVMALARAVNYLFKKHYAVAYHMILGFVVASTVVIIPIQFKDVLDTAFCMGTFVVGFIGAWFMDKLGKRLKAE